MWLILNIKDSYHQEPLKVEHGPLTCKAIPIGSMQWKILLMRLKISSAIFQRLMAEFSRLATEEQRPDSKPEPESPAPAPLAGTPQRVGSSPLKKKHIHAKKRP